jgi:hypothetical protein
MLLILLLQACLASCPSNITHVVSTVQGERHSRSGQDVPIRAYGESGAVVFPAEILLVLKPRGQSHEPLLLVTGTDEYGTAWIPGELLNRVRLDQCALVYSETTYLDENGERLPRELPAWAGRIVVGDVVAVRFALYAPPLKGGRARLRYPFLIPRRPTAATSTADDLRMEAYDEFGDLVRNAKVHLALRARGSVPSYSVCLFIGENGFGEIPVEILGLLDLEVSAEVYRDEGERFRGHVTIENRVARIRD